MNQQTKKCPYCGEEILTVAKKCKHCGEWLAEENDRQIQPYASNHHRQTEWLEEDNDRQIQQQMKLLENADNNNNRGCGCGTILIVVLLIAAYLTNPKEEKFHTAIVEDVIKNIADKTSSGLSNISENSFVGEIGSWIVKESRENLKKKFYEQNEVKINNYWLFSTAELINSDNVGGTTVAWGVFGVVIPFVGWDDFKILNMNSKKESNTQYKYIEESNNIPERNNVDSYEKEEKEVFAPQPQKEHIITPTPQPTLHKKENTDVKQEESKGTGFHFEPIEPPKQEETRIFDMVEQPPSFPGGQAALLSWINSHVKYPPIAEENGIQGRVIVGFVVERDGSISQIQVIRGVDPSLDKEAARVVASMPKWTPGRQKGQNVRVKYNVPVNFKLQ